MTTRQEYQKQYRAAHREEAKAYQKQHRKEHAAKIAEQRKAYREEHREEINERQRQLGVRSPEKRHEYYRRYYDKNAEKIKAHQREYAKTNRKSAVRWEKNKRAWIDALGGQCAMCGDKDFRHLEIDHINNDGYKEGYGHLSRPNYPVSMADPAKYQVLCANCHADKHWELNHVL